MPSQVNPESISIHEVHAHALRKQLWIIKTEIDELREHVGLDPHPAPPDPEPEQAAEPAAQAAEPEPDPPPAPHNERHGRHRGHS